MLTASLCFILGSGDFVAFFAHKSLNVPLGHDRLRRGGAVNFWKSLTVRRAFF